MIQVLQTIGLVLTIVICGATAFFAVAAWFRLRRMEKDIDEVKCAAMTTEAVTMGDHLRQSFHEINSMQDTLRSLLDEERYEDAERLKKVIIKAQQSALSELKKFKQRFGDDICDVKVTKVPISNGKEDEA